MRIRELIEPFLLILAGLFKKVILIKHAFRAISRAGFCRARELPCRRCTACHIRLRGADLLRLLRIHGHCYRVCAVAGLPLSAKFQCVLYSDQPAGLLEPLAYFAIELAARLSLCSAGWSHVWCSVNRRRTSAIAAARGGLWHGASWTFVIWGLQGISIL